MNQTEITKKHLPGFKNAQQKLLPKKLIVKHLKELLKHTSTAAAKLVCLCNSHVKLILLLRQMNLNIWQEKLVCKLRQWIQKMLKHCLGKSILERVVKPSSN